MYGVGLSPENLRDEFSELGIGHGHNSAIEDAGVVVDFGLDGDGGN